MGIGESAPVIGTPPTATAPPFAPSTSVGVGVKETVRGRSWNNVTPLSVYINSEPLAATVVETPSS